jgi:hypothetical protein
VTVCIVGSATSIRRTEDVVRSTTLDDFLEPLRFALTSTSDWMRLPPVVEMTPSLM